MELFKEEIKDLNKCWLYKNNWTVVLCIFDN